MFDFSALSDQDKVTLYQTIRTKYPWASPKSIKTLAEYEIKSWKYNVN